MKVETPTAQQAAAAGEFGGGGGVFFCVAVTSRGRTDRLSYFQAEGDGDDAEKAARDTAALCLGHAPAHHRWHHHTVTGRRTFAFLAGGGGDDGRTYFAVADPTPGGAETVRLLERVRDAFGASGTRRRGARDDAVDTVVWQFVQALRAAASSRGGEADDEATFHGDSRSDDASSAGAGDSDSDSEKDDEEEDRGDGVVPTAEGERWRIRRSSSSRSRWRQSKVVIGLELVLFLVLFVVWMVVCNGFSCVQR